MTIHRTQLPLFASLGLASGLCSALIGIDRPFEDLQPIASIFGLHPALLPIGCVFALAMAVGAWRGLGRGSAVLVVALATLYGWSGAIHIAIRLQRNLGDDVHLLAAGLAAGAFGAGLVGAAFAVYVPALRRPRVWATVCLVGAAAGLLFYAGERGVIDKGALYLVWQAAVAAMIGWHLDRATAT